MEKLKIGNWEVFDSATGESLFFLNTEIVAARANGLKWYTVRHATTGKPPRTLFEQAGAYPTTQDES